MMKNHLYTLMLALILSLMFSQTIKAEVFRVGHGEKYTKLAQIKWNELKPGDEVKIIAGKKPYSEKFILKRSGTRKKPIKITGIPDQAGNLPVIEGSNANNFQKHMDTALARRAIIIIGGSQPEERADFILIQNLELRNANNTQYFYINNQKIKYADNGAGVYVQQGNNVMIKGCKIHSCCMGVQTAYYPDVGSFILTQNIIYNNGDFTRQRWSHNVYLGARKSVVEFNRFGELYSDGNSIKDRSNLTIIRYNWIEGGMSRQIDLVETKKYPVANAYVYGNVIISGKRTKNPKMVLFGGDAGENSSRRGTLYFFNNTIHFKKKELHGFIWVNRKDCRAVLANNIFLGGKKIWMGKGSVTGFNNLVDYGANKTGLSNSYTGGLEQMWTKMNIPYFPGPGSVLVNNGFLSLPAKVLYVPMPWPEKKRRPVFGAVDIGAYEFF